MIVFNGISLNSIAPVRIEDVKVSPISYNPVVRPRAVRFGSDFVRMGGGTRTVTLSLAVLQKDMTNRHESFMNISKWARTDGEYMLELPTDPTRCLFCVCTSKPEPSTRAWWENKLKLVFTCYDNPYWTSKQEKSVSCGTQFNVLGDAPPLMRIERTLSGAASDQSYSNSDQTMTFSTIPAGDMVIDLTRQTAAVDGTSIMQYYAPSGSFVIPRTGIQTITGTGTVKYRERWE